MTFKMAALAATLVFVPLGASVEAAAPVNHATARAVPEILRQPGAVTRSSADDVRSVVEDAFQTLVDADTARNRGASAVSQRDAVRKAADKIFDWREMTRDALGKHWARTTPGQRDRITQLLPQLFERLYLPTLDRTGPSQAAMIGSSIVFAGESIEGDTAVVHTIWKRSARDLPVDWSMRRRARAWRIHDITLDGISVVDNYRAQFDHVIQRSSRDDLVARMEAKVNSAPPTDPPVTARLATKARPELSAGDLP
jgi:phospholipid transport system substrate-binding protein